MDVLLYGELDAELTWIPVPALRSNARSKFSHFVSPGQVSGASHIYSVFRLPRTLALPPGMCTPIAPLRPAAID